jgi:hypothetical protein
VLQCKQLHAHDHAQFLAAGAGGVSNMRTLKKKNNKQNQQKFQLQLQVTMEMAMAVCDLIFDIRS